MNENRDNQTYCHQTREGIHLPEVLGWRGKGVSYRAGAAASQATGSWLHFSVCKVKFLKLAALVVMVTWTVVSEHFRKSFEIA